MTNTQARQSRVFVPDAKAVVVRYQILDGERAIAY
jgi:hypothetical protein